MSETETRCPGCGAGISLDKTTDRNGMRPRGSPEIAVYDCGCDENTAQKKRTYDCLRRQNDQLRARLAALVEAAEPVTRLAIWACRFPKEYHKLEAELCLSREALK
jgi:hypothetical protein